MLKLDFLVIDISRLSRHHRLHSQSGEVSPAGLSSHLISPGLAETLPGLWAI